MRLYPPTELVNIDTQSESGAFNGLTTLARQWRMLERSAQHYIMYRHHQESAMGMRGNCYADVTYSGACTVMIVFTAPLLWHSSYIWCSVDGYELASSTATVNTSATLSVDGVGVGVSKNWSQGWQPTLIDWEEVFGTGGLTTPPDTHYATIDLVSDAEGITVRSAGIIHRSASYYEVP